MKLKADRVLKKVRDNLETARMGRVNLYLNLNTVKRFKAACQEQGLGASPVVEELMREFLLTVQPSQTKAKSGRKK